ncbi:MAG: tRNA-dihydrouridine synthase family protein [Oscillibacter sp.]|nr:tRNA-dihydrouridine synthase family protein [Oscillibacter sp.]
MIRRLDFAPLDGITRLVYRRVWQRRFGGTDRFFLPFFSPTPQHVMTERDLREMSFSQNAPLPCVPQIMTRNAEDFLWGCEVVREMGYTEANLNLGCPSGTVTAKGKGAGFLADPDALDRFFDTVFSRVTIPVSVKTRLGVSDAGEFARLLEVFNRYPVACLIVHARVKTEKYRPPIREEGWAEALKDSRNPVCCNGDLRTVGEVRAFEEKFPTAEHVMIGRGLLADPALARKLRGGAAADRAELSAFLDELYDGYVEWYGGQTRTAAQRMREVWFYLIHLFDENERLGKQMRRFRTGEEYRQIQSEILASLPLRRDAQGDLI